MKSRRVLWFLLVGLLLPGIVFSQRANDLSPIRFEDYRLKNGLRVILHQDKSTPIVAVNVWYHVGSKNEIPGKTGFAHLFEHMMYQGSKNYDNDFYRPLQEVGVSYYNAVTTQDGTNYVETLPSNFLERILYLEAGRMGGLLEAMTQEKLDNQRDVVKNERRQTFVNQPYASWFLKVFEEMYPANHPYHWKEIGSMEDLSAASLDDLKTFFRRYYVPNNAILSIAGDFDEKQTKQWIEKYFGPIPRGAEIVRPNPPRPKLNGEIRRTVEDSISLPRLYLAWHGVPKYSAGEAELEMLGNILSAGRGSRLQANLLFGKQIAQDVAAFTVRKELGGYFQIQATARPGKSLDEIEKEINFEIERIKRAPPSEDEMRRALNQIESQIVFNLQTVLEKSDVLSEFAGYLNRPDYSQANLDRYRKVTPAGVQKAANDFLTANRLVMSFVPRKSVAPQTDTADDRPTSTKPKNIDEALIAKQTAALPKPGPNPKLSLPPIERAKLSNGLEVWMVRQNELPILSMNMVVKSGIATEPDDKLGISAMTVNLLRTGTGKRSALDISNQLQSVGANVTTNLGWDSTTIGMQTLSKNLDEVLDIYADVIMNPTFSDAEVENVRRRTLGRFVQQKSDPGAIANRILNRTLYGTNAYGRPFSGDENGVKSISRDDLVKYYGSIYRPGNAVLIVTGDVEKNNLMPRLEKVFGSWKSLSTATNESPKIPDIQPLKQTTIYLVDRPGSAQSSVVTGLATAPRSNPDYISLEVMNAMLGRGVTSRLNQNLRESKGYTYGVASSFTYFKGAGHYTASADVQTGVTKESIVEFMKELNGIRGAIPVTQKELDDNKQGMIRKFPAGFETIGAISFQLSNLVIFGLPDSYFNDYIQNVDAVTLADINRVTSKYLTPDNVAIVIVGDRKAIEASLQSLGYPIVFLDENGDPVQ